MSEYLQTSRQLQSRIPFAKAVGIAHSTGPYHCPELTKPCARAGGDAAQQLPSRAGNRLVYRDGRVERLKDDAL
ncbi:hypothetical protein [Variovorax sp. HJSM1_2]|uniref:hypothetical protein n=1 Tax=Variovorax sp. HJSM1_2 TaxID=3366263 RepID=UPI003BC28501